MKVENSLNGGVKILLTKKEMEDMAFFNMVKNNPFIPERPKIEFLEINKHGHPTFIVGSGKYIMQNYEWAIL